MFSFALVNRLTVYEPGFFIQMKDPSSPVGARADDVGLGGPLWPPVISPKRMFIRSYS